MHGGRNALVAIDDVADATENSHSPCTVSAVTPLGSETRLGEGD